LDRQTLALVRIAVATAMGDETKLRDRMIAARAVHVPPHWVDELLLQSFLNVGYPLALVAFGVWRSVAGPVLDSEKGEPIAHPEWDTTTDTDKEQGIRTRRIGDVILMWIPIHEYERIQKRIMLASRFKEANISQKLSDFVRENEGLVKVVQGNEDPQTLYQKANPNGGKLQHSSRAPSGYEA